MNVLHLWIDGNYNLHLELSPVAAGITVFIVGVAAWIIISDRFSGWRWGATEGTIQVGNTSVTLKPSYDDLQIAYRLWTEMNTRKIGLPVDEKDDVIVEVYDSWYEFFKVTRELIQDVPVRQIRKSESTRKLVAISVDLLNRGIRPHLTKWQARFRFWWRRELDERHDSSLDPQSLQKKFPEYEALMADLKSVNKQLVQYSDSLEGLIYHSSEGRPLAGSHSDVTGDAWN